MEPIIYKPGAYKSPGIYNGAGGIYNGRGVYNDGASGDLFYYTEFKNFDLSTKEDNPIIGPKVVYSVNKNLQKNVIDGRTCLQLWNTGNGDANLAFGINPYSVFPDGFTAVSETNVIGSYIFGGFDMPSDSPFYLPYNDSCCIHPYNVTNTTLYNGAYITNKGGEICLLSSNMDTNSNHIAEGTVYYNRNTKDVIIGMNKKKYISGKYDGHLFRQWWTKSGYTNKLNIFSLKIYKGFKEVYFQ